MSNLQIGLPGNQRHFLCVCESLQQAAIYIAGKREKKAAGSCQFLDLRREYKSAGGGGGSHTQEYSLGFGRLVIPFKPLTQKVGVITRRLLVDLSCIESGSSWEKE